MTALGTASRSGVNVGRLLSQAALSHPDRVAIRYGERIHTYGELDRRTNQLAAGLSQLGLTQGDRVVVWLANCPEYLEVFFACWKLGLAVVPMNARLTPADVAFHVNDCTAGVLIYGAEFAEGAKGIEVPHRVCIGGGADDRGYEELLDPSAVTDQCREFAADTPAWLFYTSGTTGRPKGAVLTHGILQFVVVSWCADLYQVQPEDVVLHCAPLSHGAGFLALVATARGAENVLHARWDPVAFCDAVSELNVTATWLVPTQIRMLLDSTALDGADLGSLQSVVYGGSPMHLTDVQEALRRIGPILCQIYGQGESPMTISYLRPTEHLAGHETGGQEQRLLSAGRVRTGMELDIRDDDDQPVAPGAVGEVTVRGPAVMPGYWERPDETSETLAGGWLHTGDLGRIDERGFLYVLDRKKDFIISGGSNVYAREVEDTLLEHPRVHEAAVFGVPDRLWGEAVTAVVVGDAIDSQTLEQHAKIRLADYKRPKSIHIADQLPKNAYGKVLKRELRQIYDGPSSSGPLSVRNPHAD